PAPIRTLSPLPATATTETHTPSLHDALPISTEGTIDSMREWAPEAYLYKHVQGWIYYTSREGSAMITDEDYRGFIHHSQRESEPDRKSTRLNSSHVSISYAVFCLKKKKITTK